MFHFVAAVYPYTRVPTYTHVHTSMTCSVYYTYRLKSLKDELQKLEARLVSSERNAASLDAQRKAALADKGRLNKQVFCCVLTECLID